MVPTANGAERNTILGGWSVAVAECSEGKEAAWEFVKFLTRPDIAAIYTNTFYRNSGSGGALCGLSGGISHQTNAEALQYASALPAVKNIVGIRQAIMDNLQLMLSEDMSARRSRAVLDQAVNGFIGVIQAGQALPVPSSAYAWGGTGRQGLLLKRRKVKVCLEKIKRSGAGYVLPAVLVVAVVMLYPLFYTLIMGFFNNTLFMQTPVFCGISQYKKLCLGTRPL